MKRGASSSRRENPIVFLDITVNDKHIGRLIIELRADIVPRTAENFRMLCTGDSVHGSGESRRYTGCDVHRIVRDSLLQAGNLNGDGGHSAFETRYFDDENFILRHVGVGTVSMVNAGPDTNASQFFITFASASWMDNRHVVCGALLGEASFATLAKIHDLAATESGLPRSRVRIGVSGQLFPA
ncbi:unnamed protein product [Aphanomyces euteiches]|nr:hypothetical protein Ae201684P_012163 [Aphanomyces euteiches]